jgi:sensor domain CHASE-containing protein
MSLGLKSLLLIAAVMVVSVLAQFSILGKVALPGLLAVEREAAVDRLQRAKAAAADGQRELSDYARDWAAWPETASYAAHPSADYPFADMVTGTLLAEDIDLFGLYDTKGALLWGALSEARLASFSVNPDELEVFLAQAMERLPRDEAPPTGVVAVAGRAAYYTVKPLIYEAYGAGVVGYLAMLRFIDAMEIARWETLVGGILRVVPIDESDPAAEDSPSPSGPQHLRAALEDAAGQPAFWLEISVDEEAFAAARASLGRSMDYSLLVGAATFFVLLGAIQGVVLRPISRLARELLRIMPEENSYTTRRLTMRSRDEVGVIATEVNALFARLEAVTSDEDTAAAGREQKS